MWRRAKELVALSRDCERYQRAVAERRAWLKRLGLPVNLVASKQAFEVPSPKASTPLEVRRRAAQVTSLYFHQLWHGDVTFIDLRADAFRPSPENGGTGLDWRPASWLVQWDPGFIDSMRQVYAGFFSGNSSDFRAGLTALNLQHAEEALRAHFGTTRVKFEVKHFVHTFHQIFIHCRDAGATLHPDFLPLGLYLATLYDHLEQLDVSVDVAASFELGMRPIQQERHREASHA